MQLATFNDLRDVRRDLTDGLDGIGKFDGPRPERRHDDGYTREENPE